MDLPHRTCLVNPAKCSWVATVKFKNGLINLLCKNTTSTKHIMRKKYIIIIIINNKIIMMTYVCYYDGIRGS